MKKLTVIGDIMCEPPVFKQAEREGGKYDFLPAFEHLKPLLSEADYVLGNLETPLAGKDLGYTFRLVSFNAPIDLAVQLKELGVDMVSTANNHVCDRGSDGIGKTIENLDKAGLAHSGTYVNYKPDMPERVFYQQIGDTKIAVICYTYGSNYGLNLMEPDEAAGVHCNYLRPVKTKLGVGSRKFPEEYKKILELLDRVKGEAHIWEDEVDVRNILGITQAYADDVLEPAECEPYMAQLKSDYEEARKNADLVFIMPHMGGQFNEKPGAFSNYMMYQFMQMGFDGVFAAHSHTLQQAKAMEGKPFFWSMGNVSMAPFSAYAARETLPEYAVAAHLYLEGGKIERMTFSITKIVEEEDGLITVYPVDALYENYMAAGLAPVVKPGCSAASGEKIHGKVAAQLLEEETAKIYSRVTGRAFPGIQHEYDL